MDYKQKQDRGRSQKIREISVIRGFLKKYVV